jgi:hypothetical protein
LRNSQLACFATLGNPLTRGSLLDFTTIANSTFFPFSSLQLSFLVHLDGANIANEHWEVAAWISTLRREIGTLRWVGIMHADWRLEEGFPIGFGGLPLSRSFSFSAYCRVGHLQQLRLVA